jgi:SAM-dependent methyltransferase
MASEPLRHEKYTHGHAPATVRQHARRTADEAAAFLLPELRPGMRLLDVGCGPGSITRGLAERIAPGQAIGLDLSRETLSFAREDAAARGLENLRYEEGSVYDLPFPAASFDIVFAHQVLQHLREPDTALREMLRVVRSGGTGHPTPGSTASWRFISRPGIGTAGNPGSGGSFARSSTPPMSGTSRSRPACGVTPRQPRPWRGGSPTPSAS